MTDNELLLEDRIQKIRQVIGKYGEENFVVAFSGGKDSTVMSHLLDMAIPGNKIPRVYTNTGIEFRLILKFVERERERDSRIEVIEPTTPIKPMLERDGYPFKSKGHSEQLERYKRIGKTKGVLQYLGEREDKEPWSSQKSCPKCLKYQFTEEFKMNISDKCCERLKEEPFAKWQKENNKPIGIVGVMRDEGGRRSTAQCLAFKGKKPKNFQPLAPITKKWEEWYIEHFGVEICEIYKEPYNLPRTGCKGCPFATNLQKELDMLQEFFPAERKQCEAIWKPVYDEYRRIGYRLKKDDGYKQMTLDDYGVDT